MTNYDSLFKEILERNKLKILVSLDKETVHLLNYLKINNVMSPTKGPINDKLRVEFTNVHFQQNLKLATIPGQGEFRFFALLGESEKLFLLEDVLSHYFPSISPYRNINGFKSLSSILEEFMVAVWNLNHANKDHTVQKKELNNE